MFPSWLYCKTRFQTGSGYTRHIDTCQEGTATKLASRNINVTVTVTKRICTQRIDVTKRKSYKM